MPGKNPVSFGQVNYFADFVDKLKLWQISQFLHVLEV